MPPIVVPWPPRYLVTEWIDDVGAVLERAAQIRRRHRVVDDERNAGVVRDRGDRRDVADVELRIADRLGVERLRVRRERRRKLSGSSASTNVASMPNCSNVTRELRVGAAVERARRDDVVARCGTA